MRLTTKERIDIMQAYLNGKTICYAYKKCPRDNLSVGDSFVRKNNHIDDLWISKGYRIINVKEIV